MRLMFNRRFDTLVSHLEDLIIAAMIRFDFARVFVPALLGFFLVLTGPQAASAQAVERIETFQNWTAWKTTENGQMVCFMGARPVSDEGNYTRRGEISFVVTHRPHENRIGEVAYTAGYSYQEDSTVDVSIDGTVYKLLTAGSNAWPANAETDRAIIQAMIRGASAVVQGYSSRGTLTTDTYSLSGFTAAYEAISTTCGVN